MKRKSRAESKKNNVVSIKQWPEGDRRPKKSHMKKGMESLSDAALLGILLQSGHQGKDATTLAEEILTQLGGLSGLMSTTSEDLMTYKGVGKTKIARILAATEMVKRQIRHPLARLDVSENPGHLYDYLRVSMAHLERTEFRVLYLNRSRHLISENVLVKGTPDMSFRYDRKVVETAIEQKASSLILVHNHPTDLPLASDEDIELTKALVAACWRESIPILDHVVIGKNTLLSLKRYHPEIFEGEDDIA